MPNITLSISEKMHKEIAQHPEIKWSQIVRQVFDKKLNELHWIDAALSVSELTEEDVERIGHNIKAKIRKRLSR